MPVHSEASSGTRSVRLNNKWDTSVVLHWRRKKSRAHSSMCLPITIVSGDRTILWRAGGGASRLSLSLSGVGTDFQFFEKGKRLRRSRNRILQQRQPPAAATAGGAPPSFDPLASLCRRARLFLLLPRPIAPESDAAL